MEKCQWLLDYPISIIRLYPAYSRLPTSKSIKQVVKKQSEDILIDIITWNLLSYPPFHTIIIKKPNLVHSVSDVNKS